jgi:hypothetical protein
MKYVELVVDTDVFATDRGGRARSPRSFAIRAWLLKNVPSGESAKDNTIASLRDQPRQDSSVRYRCSIPTRRKDGASTYVR